MEAHRQDGSCLGMGVEEVGNVSGPKLGCMDSRGRTSPYVALGSFGKLRLFLRCGLDADFLQIRRSGSCAGCPRHEELMIVKIAVHTSRDLCRFGPEGRMSALQEDDGHNASDVGIGIRGEPSEARAGARTGPGLA